jgi:hypothetical protein
MPDCERPFWDGQLTGLDLQWTGTRKETPSLTHRRVSEDEISTQKLLLRPIRDIMLSVAIRVIITSLFNVVILR